MEPIGIEIPGEFIMVAISAVSLALIFSVIFLLHRFDGRIDDLRDEFDRDLTEAIENHHIAMHDDDDDDDEALTPRSYEEFCKASEAMGDLYAALLLEGRLGEANAIANQTRLLHEQARSSYSEFNL